MPIEDAVEVRVSKERIAARNQPRHFLTRNRDRRHRNFCLGSRNRECASRAYGPFQNFATGRFPGMREN
jgi:hypothetical protein